VREVVVDPELLAAGILGRARPRRFLGLLAYGAAAQYAELFGPAEDGLIREELEPGERLGACSIQGLIEQARDRRARLNSRLPYGAPDDLVMVASKRLIDVVVDRVELARETQPGARDLTDIGDKARRIVDFLAQGRGENIMDNFPPTESLSDHLIHMAALASAPIVTDDPILVPSDDRFWRHTDPSGGLAAYAISFWLFVDRHIDRGPFALDAVPYDLLAAALLYVEVPG
jgi:hypothetical protein